MKTSRSRPSFAEVLGHRQAGQAHAQARTGRLVHLAEDHHGLVDDARLGHFACRAACLRGCARPRRRTPSSHRAAAAMLRISSVMITVLPTPAPPKMPILPPLVKGAIRSMTFMPVSKTCGFGRLVGEGGGRAVDAGTYSVGCDRARLVNRLAQHVEDAAQGGRADRHRDRLRRCPARPCRGAGRRCCPSPRAHPVVAQVLLHLEPPGSPEPGFAGAALAVIDRHGALRISTAL